MILRAARAYTSLRSAPAPMSVATLEPRPFTVDEYHAMGEAGLFTEDDRVELLDGIIIAMSPIGAPHTYVVNRLTELLLAAKLRAGLDVTVSVQNPLRLGPLQEPQPDVALLRGAPSPERVPAAADALLVIEVADATLATDREVKGPRYAAAGVPELWIVDVQNRRIEVLRQPGATGYTDRRSVEPGGELTVAALPEAGAFAATDVLGPEL